MQDILVTFDIAKLAKEKGFDEYCINSYLNSSKETYSHLSQGIVSIKKHGYLKRKSLQRKNSDMANAIDERFSAPTQSLLQKMLREKHNIFVFVDNPQFRRIKDQWEPSFSYKIFHEVFDSQFEYGSIMDTTRSYSVYKSYEEALEIGLQEGLKLIKIK